MLLTCDKFKDAVRNTRSDCSLEVSLINYVPDRCPGKKHLDERTIVDLW